ncbi:hypothetical protein [Pandoraea pnomenusa]|uniref:hypothetical protein n=1 Tax=Pandoraea pnomenusa TaxID=93220 RepID=UPI00333EDA65
MAQKTPNDWASETLTAKAVQYAELMLEQPRDGWQFGFWSALCLEMLLRATLGSFSTVLLADAKDWNNLLFALDMKGSSAKISPKSIDASEVISRLEQLLPTFTRELANFCVIHLQRRNAELHSGSLPFEGLSTSSWLPQFYEVAKVVLTRQNLALSDVFGKDEASTADTLIEAIKDDAAKAVKGTINAHQTIWQDKPEEERKALAEAAEIKNTRALGHRVSCPACGSVSLLHGSSAGSETQNFKDGLIVVRQPMLPSSFECTACGLKIVGYSKLSACGLGGTFTSTSTFEPVDYFEDDFQSQYAASLEEDNNE